MSVPSCQAVPFGGVDPGVVPVRSVPFVAGLLAVMAAGAISFAFSLSFAAVGGGVPLTPAFARHGGRTGQPPQQSGDDACTKHYAPNAYTILAKSGR